MSELTKEQIALAEAMLDAMEKGGPFAWMEAFDALERSAPAPSNPIGAWLLTQHALALRERAETAERKRDALTFAQLASAHEARAKEWTHDGPPLPLAFSIVELCGEAGELANAAKKVMRHEHGMKGGSPDTANLVEEVADVVICASLVARKLGIDLGEAVAAKFNATSAKHGFTTTLPIAAAQTYSPRKATDEAGALSRVEGGAA